jgi:hypothetical protein
MAGLRSGQVELTLQVVVSDLDVAHGHVSLHVTQEGHQCRQTDASANQLGGIGVATIPAPE